MIILIIFIIWAIISLFLINKDMQENPGQPTFKMFIGTSIAFVLLVGRSVFDPSLNRMIGGVIEINDSWNQAVLLGIGLGAAITGPVAGIRCLKYWRERKEENKEYAHLEDRYKRPKERK